jgi:glutamate--cysteine ligase
MPKVGTLGHQMMFRSCTVQTNLDFSSEADMVKKMRVSLALQPLATALFANSPFKDGGLNGFLSYRAHVWTDTDRHRTGDLPFAFEDGYGYERYVDWALDTPMYFVKREGKFLDASGLNFRDFLKGKLSILPGELPVLSDWEDHLSTLFPEVRLKTFLEQDYVKDWTAQERAALRTGAARHALHTPFRDRTLQNVAKDILAIARAGLKARARMNAHGEHEALFLDDLDEIAKTGISPAERLIERYKGAWGESVEPVFEEAAY